MNEPTRPRILSSADLVGGARARETVQVPQGFVPARSGGGSADFETDDEVDILRLLGHLWRGKWFILLCAFLAACAGGYYAFEVAVPKYTATTRLAIQAQDQQIVDLESVISGVSTEQAAINTELEVIRSSGLLEQLVVEMNLIDDPEFNPALQEPSVLSRRGLIEFVTQYVPIPISAEDPPLTAEEIEIKVVENVREAISVSSKNKTYLLNISATSEGPRKSSEMANRLAKIYLNDQIGIKFAATEFAVNWLSERVTELELELKDKEDAIKELRAETNLISLDALEALNIRAKEVRDRLSDVQLAVVTFREKAKRYTDLAAAQDVAAILAEVDDAALNRLGASIQAGELGAQVAFFARFDSLVQREVANAARQAAQREALQASYDKLLSQVDVQNADLVQLNQLTREADATRILYETFLTRLKETSVQIGLQQADSRVLSRANPGKQVEPRKSMILALSLILGGMIGSGIILLRNYLNESIRTADDLENLTGYSVLGQIPTMPIRGRKGLIHYLQSKPTSASAEAIRNLRTSVLLSNVDIPPQVIMSTSSIPGEGKTTQAIALAHNLVGMGKTVLLIEGDIRRRTLSEYFKQKPPGNLVSVVSGEQTLEEAVIQDDQLGAHVLMGSKTSINAADLFSSDKFKDLVETAREEYDFIIIDSPPVLVVPDARIVARLCDAVIYSVKWDSTGKHLVIDGLRQFTSVGVKVTGLVLSQVDGKRMKRYGYGGKYGSYAQYGRGYYDA